MYLCTCLILFFPFHVEAKERKLLIIVWIVMHMTPVSLLYLFLVFHIADVQMVSTGSPAELEDLRFFHCIAKDFFSCLNNGSSHNSVFVAKKSDILLQGGGQAPFCLQKGCPGSGRELEFSVVALQKCCGVLCS